MRGQIGDINFFVEEIYFLFTAWCEKFPAKKIARLKKTKDDKVYFKSTELRAKAQTKIEKTLLEILNTSLYGRRIEVVRKKRIKSETNLKE